MQLGRFLVGGAWVLGARILFSLSAGLKVEVIYYDPRAGGTEYI